ncbi:class F sortase [Pseudactinotalea suaedae]|uniref:class F sortase n=1 Tax=Pseudactinotalea suaedae TaxID=1524924 RepID=UPI0012E208C8|nr:class F sortase [Pseudactinotalea suaedae]
MSRSSSTSAARVPGTPAAGARPVPVAFLALALALGLGACGSDPLDPEAATSEPSPTAAPTEAATAEAATTAPTPLEDVTLVDATEPVTMATAGTPPTAVEVPDLGLAMPVQPVGIAADGQTEVPPDALEAGWYRFGPGAGADAGATVILAHAGSEITPRGPFSELDQLQGGELVTVTDADGVEHEYEVTSVQVLEKATLDLDPYFVRDGEPTLVLITCGGQWDEAESNYRSNVIVTAAPVGSR